MGRRRSPMLLLWVLLLGAVHVAVARRMEPCEIARQLLKHGVPQHQLNDWVCLVMSESGGDTAAINKVNSDGSWDYGLFQINNKHWCGPGKGCNVACSELLTDDISKAVDCALKIYREGTDQYGRPQFFNSWVGWRNKCKGKKQQDVTGCVNQSTCKCGSRYSFY